MVLMFFGAPAPFESLYCISNHSRAVWSEWAAAVGEGEISVC